MVWEGDEKRRERLLVESVGEERRRLELGEVGRGGDGTITADAIGL